MHGTFEELPGRATLIVRVKLPQGSLMEGSVATVTTEHGQTWEVPVSQKVLKLMGQNTTLCVYAFKRDDGTIKLLNRAPWQSWA